jgi:Tol biopolymer transport system component
VEADNAEFPVASPDGKWLAYLRSERGRSQAWLRDLRESASVEKPITAPGLNVFEMSFLPDDSIVLAGAEEHHTPRLFLIKQNGHLQQIIEQEARYPSVSPDGQWLAYSRRTGGAWNLWIRRTDLGDERRVTGADCNDVSPSWEADSKTLLFASDCGRSFGLTALYRQRVLP